MKVAAFFAGIGGIEEGLRRAGHETVFFCEYDPYAQAVLRDHFGHEPLGDVVKVAPGDVPDGAEIFTAGFPCQDLSQAGRTAGINGNKSGVVSHLFRLLGTKKVPWLFIENVSFMLQLDRGDAMRYLTEELERLGYRWAYRVIDSRSFGLPQRRKRAFLLASTEGDPARLLFQTNEEPAIDEHTGNGEPCGFYWTEGKRGLGWARGAVPTLKGGSGLGIPSPPAIWFPKGREGYVKGVQFFTPSIRDAERLQGFDRDWTAAAAEVDGRGERARWRLIGNAVSVDAANWVGDLLAAQREGELPDSVPLSESAPWPSAAFGSDAGRFAVPEASTWPLDGSTDGPSLAEIVAEPKPLSLRATNGFLNRFVDSPLRKPPGLIPALRKHATAMKRLVPVSDAVVKAAVG